MSKYLTIKLCIVTLLSLLLSVSINSIFKIPIKAQNSNNTIGFRTTIIDQNQNLAPDGFYKFKFMLFPSNTSTNVLWSETYNNLQIKNGTISVSLGSINPLNNNIFLNNPDLFLQICWDANAAPGDGVGVCGGDFEEQFLPRRKLNATPFAFRARDLGPATITNSGDTAYKVTSSGSSGNIFNFSHNLIDVLTLSTNGTLNISNGNDNISISSQNKLIQLPSLSSINFGNNQSIVSSNNGINLNTNNITRLTILNNGNIGIGTSSPASTLSVNGNTLLNGNLLINNGLTTLASSTAGYASLRIPTGTNPTSPISGDLWWNGTNLFFYDGLNNVDLLASTLTPPAGTSGQIQFNNSGAFGASNNLFWDGINNRLGIGTSSPTSTLSVNGSTLLNGSLLVNNALTTLASSTAGYASLRIPTGTNPTSPVSGDLWWNGTNLFFYDGLNNVDLIPQPCTNCFYNGGNSFGGNAVLGLNDNFSLDIRTNGINRARVYSNGAFAIGDLASFNQNNNFFGILTTGTMQKLGGSYNSLDIGLDYAAQNNSGSETVNGIRVNVNNNTTDSTSPIRARAIYYNITNNVSAGGLVISGQSGVVNNNANVLRAFGNVNTINNIGNVSDYAAGGAFFVDNNGNNNESSGGRFVVNNNVNSNISSGGRFFVNNYGNSNNIYGGAFVVNNYGNSDDIYGLRNGIWGHSSGIVNGNVYGNFNFINGLSQINGDSFGIYSDNIGADTFTNRVYGGNIVTQLLNSSSTNTVYGIASQTIMRDNTTSNNVYNLFVEGNFMDSVTVNNNLIGIHNEIKNSVTVNNNLIGIRNEIKNINLATVGGILYGYLSTIDINNNSDVVNGIFGLDNTINLNTSTLSTNQIVGNRVRLLNNTPLTGGILYGSQIFLEDNSSSGSTFTLALDLQTRILQTSSPNHSRGINNQFEIYDNANPNEIIGLRNNILQKNNSIINFSATIQENIWSMSDTTSILGDLIGINTTFLGNTLFPGSTTVLGNAYGILLDLDDSVYVTNNVYGIYIDELSSSVSGNLYSLWFNQGLSRLAPSTTSYASLRIPVGANPITPISGDLWWNGTNLYFYNGITNIDLLAGGGVPGGNDGNVQFNNSGTFGGTDDFHWDSILQRLGINTSGTPTATLDVNSNDTYGILAQGNPSYSIYIQGSPGLFAIYDSTTMPSYIYDLTTDNLFVNNDAYVSGDVFAFDLNASNNLNISNNANINNDITVGGNVYIGGVCSDSDGGDGGADGCDIAESFHSEEQLEKGDVVMLAQISNNNWKTITKTTNKNDFAIGIISSNPTIVMGNKPTTKNFYPVGLAGILPTKVTNQNGLIKRGDLVTVSDTPGHGMKANTGDLTIGIALEDQKTATDKINVLVSRNNFVANTGQPNNNSYYSDQINSMLNEINDIKAFIQNNFSSFILDTSNLNNNNLTSDNLQFVISLQSLINLEENAISFNKPIKTSEIFANNIFTDNIEVKGNIKLTNSSGIVEFQPGDTTKNVYVSGISESTKILISFISSDSLKYKITKIAGGYSIQILEEFDTPVKINYVVIN